MMTSHGRHHGGPDDEGAPVWDFSTNANACGPCPVALHAVQTAEVTHYPNPSYRALKLALAGLHKVDAGRVLLAASGSEAIARLTAWAVQRGVRQVSVPLHAYGDYASLAQTWQLEVVREHTADWVWVCDPSSPLGQAWQPLPGAVPAGVTVLDRAYEPLRLDGEPLLQALPPAVPHSAWQLWTPNKALGLTGVRGAYLIAPLDAEAETQQLEAMAPSWPLGAHAVAMLHAWTQPSVQRWLAGSRDVLRTWRSRQRQALEALGWDCRPSLANFFCARPPAPVDAVALRAQGIKLRDATSFGLPGEWRLSVQPPVAQQALCAALTAQHATRVDRPGSKETTA